jgi:hypothetical protein
MSEPVFKEFLLLTGGNDPELDAIHIIVHAIKGLQGEEIQRVFEYLWDRYTLKVTK